MVRLGVVLRAHPLDERAPLTSGAAKSPFRLLRHLRRRVDVVGVVVADHSGHRSSIPPVDGHPVRWLRLYPRTLVWNVVNARPVLRLTRRADVLQCHHPHFGLVAAAARRWAGRRFVFVVKAHGTAVPEAATSRHEQHWRRWVLSLNARVHRRHDRWVLRSADVCIVSSNFQHTEMTDLYGVDPTRLVTIYNGFDPDFRRVRDVRAGDRAGAPRFIFVGRVAPKKGLDHLVRLYEELRQRHEGASLTLVLGASDAIEHAATHRLVLDHFAAEPTCRILHDLDEPSLYRELAGADIGLVPSSGYESIPSVIFEMCAAGLPTFATYQWGIPEVLPPTFALSGDVLTDVDRIGTFVKERLITWDSAAWAASYDKFGYDRLAGEYEHLYKRLRTL